MIQDVFERAGLYFGLNPGFARAFSFLERDDLRALPVGRHEIDGDRAWAVVARGPSRPRLGALLEVHRRYIDVQCVLSGVDGMGWRPLSACVRPAAPYDPATDAALYADEPETWLMTGPGRFAVLFPGDAHMPLVGEGEVHKVILKVAVDQG